MINIGVDLGGTTIKMALINEEGKMIDKWVIATNTIDNGKQLLKLRFKRIIFPSDIHSLINKTGIQVYKSRCTNPDSMNR